jgi:hypothetical protein
MAQYEFKGIPNPTLHFRSQPNSLWNVSAPHRKHVMGLIQRAASHFSGPIDVAVCGDGNWIALDIEALSNAGHQVTLIDERPDDVHAALQSQFNGQPTDNVTVLAPVDVSGIREKLRQSSDQLNAKQVIAALKGFRHSNLQKKYHVVVSLCQMSQIMADVIEHIGNRSDQLEEVVRAVRDQHIDSLIELTKPGGYIVFVFAILSSKSLDGLDIVPDDRLSLYLSKALGEGNYFHGAHPVLVHREFSKRQMETKTITDTQLVLPWRWFDGADYYAITAITAKRAH